jgi:hypothetical protein
MKQWDDLTQFFIKWKRSIATPERIKYPILNPTPAAGSDQIRKKNGNLQVASFPSRPVPVLHLRLHPLALPLSRKVGSKAAEEAVFSSRCLKCPVGNAQSDLASWPDATHSPSQWHAQSISRPKRWSEDPLECHRLTLLTWFHHLPYIWQLENPPLWGQKAKMAMVLTRSFNLCCNFSPS